jgi:hypothetical protein
VIVQVQTRHEAPALQTRSTHICLPSLCKLGLGFCTGVGLRWYCAAGPAGPAPGHALAADAAGNSWLLSVGNCFRFSAAFICSMAISSLSVIHLPVSGFRTRNQEGSTEEQAIALACQTGGDHLDTAPRALACCQ